MNLYHHLDMIRRSKRRGSESSTDEASPAKQNPKTVRLDETVTEEDDGEQQSM